MVTKLTDLTRQMFKIKNVCKKYNLMTYLKCCFVDNSVSPTFSWKEDSKVLNSRLLGRFLFPLMRLLAILSFERYAIILEGMTENTQPK